jgi:hypothetical protein
LLDHFIDMIRFFPPAAGFAGFFAQLFPPLVSALRRLENRLLAARTWRGIAAVSLPD